MLGLMNLLMKTVQSQHDDVDKVGWLFSLVKKRESQQSEKGVSGEGRRKLGPLNPALPL